MDNSLDLIEKRIRQAFIGTRLLAVPFWGMISVLTMILYKTMDITPLQVTLFIVIKPVSTLFAPYWSQLIYKRPDRILSHLIWGNALRYIPFLFIPWIQSAWIIIASFGLYMMFYRGTFTVWTETLKTTISPLARERLMAFSSVLDYCLTALLPFALGLVLDRNPTSWRLLFPLTAAIGLLSTFFLYAIPLSVHRSVQPSPSPSPSPSWPIFKNHIIKPWKDSWSLIQHDPLFCRFQIGFMLGGASLMLLQPVIPLLFVDTLKLSYTKMLLAITVFKSIGFLLTTPLWVKFFRKVNIYYFSACVTMLITLFPLLLLSAQLDILFLYGAFAAYGIMQAGSEFGWHMSGPLFAQEKDSTLFSGTNVLAVGIRGCLIPPIGALLYTLTSSLVVMFTGSLLGLLATAYLVRYATSLKPVRV